MREVIRHLVLVRHGESEGDARREAWKRGERITTAKMPEEEGLTERGIRQCELAGRWIQRHIIEALGIRAFSGCYISPTARSEQSAVALGLPSLVLQEVALLSERNRGLTRGWHPEQHKARYPDSYRQMKHDILHWQPPGGEALVPDVINRVEQFLDMLDIGSARAAEIEADVSMDPGVVLVVGHRDWMWMAQDTIELLTEPELLEIDTDKTLCNAQIVHYSSINPETGERAPVLLWKRSVDPTSTAGPGAWHILPRVAETYALV